MQHGNDGLFDMKYGFQCLEKNVTRFEAEHAFQISPEPLVVEDINQYIVIRDLSFTQITGDRLF